MSEGEDRAHFSMWAMLASPLIAGNDPRTQSAATTAILTNALVLAVDQDPLVVPARIVAQPSGCELYDSCTWQAWARPLEGGAQAVALLNRASNSSVAVTALFSQMDMALPDTTVYEALDLWRGGASLGLWATNFTAIVPPHDVVMVKLVPQPLTSGEMR